MVKLTATQIVCIVVGACLLYVFIAISLRFFEEAYNKSFQLISQPMFNRIQELFVLSGLVGIILAIIDSILSENRIYIASAWCVLLGYLVTVEQIFRFGYGLYKFTSMFGHNIILLVTCKMSLVTFLKEMTEISKWGGFVPREDLNLLEPVTPTQRQNIGAAEPVVRGTLHSPAQLQNSGATITPRDTPRRPSPRRPSPRNSRATLTSRRTLHYPSRFFSLQVQPSSADQLDSGSSHQLENTSLSDLKNQFERYVDDSLPVSFLRGQYTLETLLFKDNNNFPPISEQLEVAFFVGTDASFAANCPTSFGTVDLVKTLQNCYNARNVKLHCIWIRSSDRVDDGDIHCSNLNLLNRFAILDVKLKYYNED